MNSFVCKDFYKNSRNWYGKLDRERKSVVTHSVLYRMGYYSWYFYVFTDISILDSLSPALSSWRAAWPPLRSFPRNTPRCWRRKKNGMRNTKRTGRNDWLSDREAECWPDSRYSVRARKTEGIRTLTVKNSIVPFTGTVQFFCAGSGAIWCFLKSPGIAGGFQETSKAASVCIDTGHLIGW